jgi:hypothetical protein
MSPPKPTLAEPPGCCGAPYLIAGTTEDEVLVMSSVPSVWNTQPYPRTIPPDSLSTLPGETPDVLGISGGVGNSLRAVSPALGTWANIGCDGAPGGFGREGALLPVMLDGYLFANGVGYKVGCASRVLGGLPGVSLSPRYTFAVSPLGSGTALLTCGQDFSNNGYLFGWEQQPYINANAFMVQLAGNPNSFPRDLCINPSGVVVGGQLTSIGQVARWWFKPPPYASSAWTIQNAEVNPPSPYSEISWVATNGGTTVGLGRRRESGQDYAAIWVYGTSGAVLQLPVSVLTGRLAFGGIAWSPTLGLFVAILGTDTGFQVYTSPNGLAWTFQTTLYAGQPSALVWTLRALQ